MTAASGVGLVGCGSISGIYLSNLARLEGVTVLACADLDAGRARAAADQYGIPRAGTTDELLADDAVQIVVNLTTPDAHASVGLAALEAGRHLYNEKPLAIEQQDADRLLEVARTRGLRVGCAPDTFLGAGLSTCRTLVDEGAIGDAVGGCAFFTCPGHERWHPQPDFYYRAGGGPLLDMGPYYLTALVVLLGPVRRVTGCDRTTFAKRTITSAPRHGDTIEVEVPTHVAGVLEFACGAIVSLMVSFDVEAARLPGIELYGSRTSLSVPDPNMFDGPVSLFDPRGGHWHGQPLDAGPTGNLRGLGVADMAAAIRDDRPHRASGELARHVLEIMHAVHESSTSGRHVELATTCDRPEPRDSGVSEGS